MGKMLQILAVFGLVIISALIVTTAKADRNLIISAGSNNARPTTFFAQISVVISHASAWVRV